MLTTEFNLKTLRALDIFEPLRDSELELLRPALTVRTCSIGDILMDEGTEGNELFILLVGQVKVVMDFQLPTEAVVNIIEPVETFGEIALLTGEPRSATVVATDTCRFLTLHREGLESVLLDNPNICLAMLKAAYRRIKAQGRRLKAAQRTPS